MTAAGERRTAATTKNSTPARADYKLRVRLVVEHVAAVFRYAHAEVAAALCMHLDVTLVLQQCQFLEAVAQRENLMHVGIEAALKFQRQFTHIVAADARLVGACR